MGTSGSVVCRARSVTVRDDGIARIRDLADALERGEQMTVIVAYEYGDGNLRFMEFGHPSVVDALTLHALRVRIQQGAVQSVEPTKQ